VDKEFREGDVVRWVDWRRVVTEWDARWSLVKDGVTAGGGLWACESGLSLVFQDAVVASASVDTSWHTTSRTVTVVDDLQRMKRQSDYHSVTSGCDVSC
jgi:hypothetical protein